MIHGDNTHQESMNISPHFYDGQCSSDGFYDGNMVQQPPQEGANNSPYDLGFIEGNNEAVDLIAIDSSDLLQIHTSESTLNQLIEENNLKMSENHPPVISNEFPNLEEFDYGYQFELNLNPSTSRKSNWYYSSKLQKVFIRLDQTFHLDAIYSPKNLRELLYVRAMMVFVDDISSPVHRCHNHMNSDRSQESNLRYYILRSENSNIKYQGSYDGRNADDRLSVLIPLGQARLNEHHMAKYSIALKFVCQNSCIGRKQTAVIFTLEDESCRILAKRVVNVKVCSCPKRDKYKDEEKYASKRPSSDQNNCPPYKKPSVVKIKEEPSSSTSPSLLPVVQQNNEGFKEIPFAIILPEHIAYNVARCVFNEITGAMALDVKNTEKYRKCLKDAKQKMDEYSNIRSQNSMCQHQGSRCLKK